MSDEELLDEVFAAADSQFNGWPDWKKQEARAESGEPLSEGGDQGAEDR